MMNAELWITTAQRHPLNPRQFIVHAYTWPDLVIGPGMCLLISLNGSLSVSCDIQYARIIHRDTEYHTVELIIAGDEAEEIDLLDALSIYDERAIVSNGCDTVV